MEFTESPSSILNSSDYFKEQLKYLLDTRPIEVYQFCNDWSLRIQDFLIPHKTSEKTTLNQSSNQHIREIRKTRIKLLLASLQKSAKPSKPTLIVALSTFVIISPSK